MTTEEHVMNAIKRMLLKHVLHPHPDFKFVYDETSELDHFEQYDAAMNTAIADAVRESVAMDAAND